MKKIFILFILIMIPSITFSQTNVSRISLDFGYIRNYQPDFGNDKLFAFSPEIKIGGNFIKDHFEWDFSLSYWDDGVDLPFNIADAVTYSYSSTSFSARLNYFPEKILLPLHFISGLSARYVDVDYIGGSDLSGNYLGDNSFFLFTFDLGAGLDLKVLEKVRLRFDALAFIPIKNKKNLPVAGWGGSLKIGVDYFIN